MAITKVCDLLMAASTLLQDLGPVRRWPRTDLQDYLNKGYAAIVAVRPDANMVRREVNLASGTKQRLNDPGSINLPTATKLLSVECNASPGSSRSISRIDRLVLDSQIPDWRSDTKSLVIEYFVYDPLDPCAFLVYPPADVGAMVEILYYAVPEPHTLNDAQLMAGGSSETIRIDDIYAPALLDYVLYRANSKDSEAGNASLAAQYYGAFKDFLDGKTKVDVALAGGGK